MSNAHRALLLGSTLLALSACTGAKMATDDEDLEQATREAQASYEDEGEVDRQDVGGAERDEISVLAEKPAERKPELKSKEKTDGKDASGLVALGYTGGDDLADNDDLEVFADMAPEPEMEPVEEIMMIPVSPSSGPVAALDSRGGGRDGRARKKSSSRNSASGSTSSTATSKAPPAPPADPHGVVAMVMDQPTADDAVIIGGQTQPENREGYTHYGINDMELVERDRFSTFSIDVDTASYSISRRKLNEGWMPNTASVRVEEFVNALDYDYDAPRAGTNGGAPFAVHMEAAPSPFQQNHHILRVGVQGAEIDQSERAPMHLTFLVDTSGSMNSPDKLGLAKTALHKLVDNLGPEDTVALATYAGSSTVVLEPTSSSKKAAIHAGIDSLSSGGGTHMDSGMNLAYEMASESYLYGAENRVIVMSDGDANIGRTSHDEILRTIQHYAEEGITLSTIGFGMGNYQDTMMEQLANKGDGNYFYIDTAKEAEKVFGQDIASTTQVIAKDVKIQVEFNPDAVTAYRLIGYENRDIADVDFRNDRVDAGEIGSGHAVTALYDVVLRDDARSQELATVRIRAKKPGPDSPAKEWATLMDGELLQSEFHDASDDFRLAFATASFAELLRGSPYLAEVSYNDVLAIARSADRNRDEDAELIGLIATAGQLSGERGPVAGR